MNQLTATPRRRSRNRAFVVAGVVGVVLAALPVVPSQAASAKSSLLTAMTTSSKLIHKGGAITTSNDGDKLSLSFDRKGNRLTTAVLNGRTLTEIRANGHVFAPTATLQNWYLTRAFGLDIATIPSTAVRELQTLTGYIDVTKASVDGSRDLSLFPADLTGLDPASFIPVIGAVKVTKTGSTSTYTASVERDNMVVVVDGSQHIRSITFAGTLNRRVVYSYQAATFTVPSTQQIVSLTDVSKRIGLSLVVTRQP